MTKARKNSIVKWRVYLILGLFIIASLVIMTRLYSVQILQGDYYGNRADRQHIRPTANIFDRGNIYFQTKGGNLVNAATVKSGYKIAIAPKLITHPEDVYNNLGFYLDLDEDFYTSRAEKENDPYEEIAKRVDHSVGQNIKDLKMNGVSILNENWRFYPGNDLAAHTIGFTAYGGSDEELRGRYGLERFYDDVLTRDTENVFSNFFVEMFSNISDSIKKEKRAGGSIITTINPEAQAFLEDEVVATRSKWNSSRVGMIVMDPHTGAIRAMTMAPTFNLNEFNLVENPSIYSNHLIESLYEMGSVFKPLTVAAGLDVGVISPNTTYNDTGSLTLDTETFYNHDKKAHGVVDMQEVLNKSLNLGAAFVVGQLGNEKYSEYMKKLIGQKSGIDLPNEGAPLISNLDSPNDIEYATASFGQGIAVTPIAITRALATLGNGGKLITPHLVEKVDYDIGFSTKIDLPEPEQIFKKETSEEISRMLVRAVDEALLGGTVAMKNYSIAAKTGTAQIAREGASGYYEDRFLHSFFGYFPAYDPEFIVFLYQTEPIGAPYASDTLTEPFMNTVQFLINHYEIPADRQEKSTE